MKQNSKKDSGIANFLGGSFVAAVFSAAVLKFTFVGDVANQVFGLERDRENDIYSHNVENSGTIQRINELQEKLGSQIAENCQNKAEMDFKQYASQNADEYSFKNSVKLGCLLNEDRVVGSPELPTSHGL